MARATRKAPPMSGLTDSSAALTDTAAAATASPAYQARPASPLSASTTSPTSSTSAALTATATAATTLTRMQRRGGATWVAAGARAGWRRGRGARSTEDGATAYTAAPQGGARISVASPSR